MISNIVKEYNIKKPRSLMLLHGIWFAYLDFEKNRREQLKKKLMEREKK